MMDIRQLRYFLAVAAERNFSRAADRLNMAQPPLSRQIQQLELEVGAQLFDRDMKPMALTDAGRLFYEQAIQVTRRMDEMKEAMRVFVSSNRPRFVVGFVPSVEQPKSARHTTHESIANARARITAPRAAWSSTPRRRA